MNPGSRPAGGAAAAVSTSRSVRVPGTTSGIRFDHQSQTVRLVVTTCVHALVSQEDGQKYILPPVALRHLTTRHTVSLQELPIYVRFSRILYSHPRVAVDTVAIRLPFQRGDLPPTTLSKKILF